MRKEKGAKVKCNERGVTIEAMPHTTAKKVRRYTKIPIYIDDLISTDHIPGCAYARPIPVQTKPLATTKNEGQNTISVHLAANASGIPALGEGGIGVEATWTHEPTPNRYRKDLGGHPAAVYATLLE